MSLKKGDVFQNYSLALQNPTFGGGKPKKCGYWIILANELIKAIAKSNFRTRFEEILTLKSQIDINKVKKNSIRAMLNRFSVHVMSTRREITMMVVRMAKFSFARSLTNPREYSCMCGHVLYVVSYQ